MMHLIKIAVGGPWTSTCSLAKTYFIEKLSLLTIIFFILIVQQLTYKIDIIFLLGYYDAFLNHCLTLTTLSGIRDTLTIRRRSKSLPLMNHTYYIFQACFYFFLISKINKAE